ncbi:MAG: hypothetical protein LBE04_08520, partial [Prevotellaceae bacterium]|nr:hypothetical protein [Prevotellaceae bacterium]
YFRKFDIPTIHSIFGDLYSWLMKNLKFDNFTMDIDSSVISRYGEQEGSSKGYNKHKRSQITTSDHGIYSRHRTGSQLLVTLR